ncbi:hypothetical protein NM208_g3561 [Fusarium decemcellulare]|uniref:Uncharacterized protein n=1 Tax=Fusarium decemcellulare TaxID=57161 RepID=A0ACC1SNX2_9HYPO|nr:hypothetical protein NM208_g3561 [Fusarium decemcellulare]
MKEALKVPHNRRRDKVQLSCDFCRKRKLKCDRKQPCGTCSSRDQSTSCHYPSETIRQPRQSSKSAPNSIQRRLSRLEDTVSSLARGLSNEGDAAVATTFPSQVQLGAFPNLPGRQSDGSENGTKVVTAPRATEHGVICTSSATTVYVSSCHWSAVMNSISGLGQSVPTLSQNQRQSPPKRPVTASSPDREILDPGPDLLYGRYRLVSKDELLQEVPDRRLVDRLVSAYFNELNLPYAFIHPASFLQQYKNFWTRPSETPLIWLGLLYGIICLGIQLGVASYDHPHKQLKQNHQPPDRPKFLEQVIQCLILGNYSRGGPFVIETLLHYLAIEHLRWPDSKVGSWLLFGTIHRLALRMGYHRDSSCFPGISVFEGEIRRRIWITIYSLDILLSLQVGLPRSIKDGQWDSQPPRNLLDAEFDGDSVELPPSRPESEDTPILLLIAEFRLVRVLGQISDWTMSTDLSREASPKTNEKALENLLRSTYDGFPKHLKFTSLTECLSQKPQDIIGKINVTALLHKALIILYRRSIMPKNTLPCHCSSSDNEDPVLIGEVNAIKTCVDAALQLLEFQNIIHTEQRPGGILHSIRWTISSTMSHEFITATVVLCAYALRIAAANPVDEGERDKMGEIGLALKRSYHIWLRQSDQSSEAKRMTDLLTFVLRRLDILNYGQSDMLRAGESYSSLVGEYGDFNLDCDWISFEDLVKLGSRENS